MYYIFAATEVLVLCREMCLNLFGFYVFVLQELVNGLRFYLIECYEMFALCVYTAHLLILLLQNEAFGNYVCIL